MTKRIDAPEAEATDVILEFPLITPIIAYGEEVTVLKLRKPTGADLLKVGNPVRLNPYADPPVVEHDFNRLISMVARLSNVPSSSLSKLEPGEMASLAWDLTPFFIPDSVDDLIGASLDLALIFKCSPLQFLEMPENEVAELYRLTSEKLRDIRSEE